MKEALQMRRLPSTGQKLRSRSTGMYCNSPKSNGPKQIQDLACPTAVAFLRAHITRETRGVMFVFSPLARLLWWRWEALRQSVLRQRAVLAAAEGCGGCGCCGGGGGGKV